jgi:replicative DNA helicase
MTTLDEPPALDPTPPQDLAAERAVLGGMLLSKTAIGDVADMLVGSNFYRPAHELIFQVILNLYADGQPADAVTVAAELTRRGELHRVGGGAYLYELMNSVPAASNAGYYAVSVKECAVRRRLIEVGQRITAMGYATDDGTDLPAIVDLAQAEAHTLSGPARDVELTNAEVFDSMLQDIDLGVAPGLMTGFVDLDTLTQGLQPGQVVIVAARPAIGKSTLVMDILRRVSIRDRLPSLMFSLEMGRPELIRRALSAEGRICLHHLAPGMMTDDDWLRSANVREQIVTAPITIDDSPNLTMMQIRATARRMREKQDIRLIAIDYAQLLDAGANRKFENRQTEVSAISRGVKLLAKELQIPIVMVAQLNRGPEQRADKKPIMSDLRESGSLEQDADVVILLHREDAYEPESPRAGEADLIVAKHRNGPTATITVAFQGHYARFVDMARS